MTIAWKVLERRDREAYMTRISLAAIPETHSQSDRLRKGRCIAEVDVLSTGPDATVSANMTGSSLDA